MTNTMVYNKNSERLYKCSELKLFSFALDRHRYNSKCRRILRRADFFYDAPIPVIFTVRSAAVRACNSSRT